MVSLKSHEWKTRRIDKTKTGVVLLIVRKVLTKMLKFGIIINTKNKELFGLPSN